ncbi:YihY/virulence factor BrkB family protein [Rhizosaccharibacter radicis]|uniref:YihY/virulence factor BrkB family protein n=1 Tax=Rhizosaccharibacter radicis TaxID=2782605 RepID=A0ABT1W0J0_9PROT|nr:YihY/virulence factor BrkB family protein [Acetobacteraceae bacterium KSS12]
MKTDRPHPLLLAGLALAGMMLPRRAEAPGLPPHPGDRRAAGTPARADGAPEQHEGEPRPDRRDDGGSAPGATASAPRKLGRAGWWAAVKRAARGFGDDRIMAEAASVTYYTLLAVFPALASLISIYGLFTDPASLGDQLAQLGTVVPEGGMSIIGDQVKALTSSNHKALGFGAIVGLLVSLWSANAAMKSFFDALNVVYHEKEKRSFVRLNLLTLGFTVSGILFLILAMSGVVVVPVVLHVVGLDSLGARLVAVLRWPALLVAVALALSVLYRFGPSRRLARWQWVSWGGTAASLGWIAASVLFSFYVSNFGSYNKTYGSLGAVIGFMTWIWISAIVVLMGAELNAELERQTASDTTVGHSRPRGKRGATVADRVAGEGAA